MWIAENWKDYSLLDTSDGQRLEKWGEYVLVRPDPQVIWNNAKRHPLWNKADAVYNRSSSGGGQWNDHTLPESWLIHYGDMTLKIKPMGFKHTGVFPEQAVNWDWLREKIQKAGRFVSVLNLFAYTGGATVAAAKEGAAVCHVDAAKGMVAAAKENCLLSGLEKAPVRYIVDDCMKFVERELRRGIIMDPPSYGRGPGGELWKLENCVDELVGKCVMLLSNNPLFFLLNSYTTGLSPSTMGYLLGNHTRKLRGKITADEVGLYSKQTGMVLGCGAAARWECD
jgi:23S rRNA (cytosine1962-C5)-methyltransferase